MSTGPRILFASSEAYPLAKTGGLGDVSGALPMALHAKGVDVRLFLPGYPGVIEAIRGKPASAPFSIVPGLDPIRIYQGQLPGGRTPVYALAAPELFARPGGLYLDGDGKDWPDNGFRYGIFCRAAALLGSDLSPLSWRAELIHCNDWQTGLVPAYLSFDPRRCARALFSIHNLAYQGNFPAKLVDQLGLPWSSFQERGLEFHGQLSFMKAGCYYAERLSTVSETYAREIGTPEFGFGLEGLLSQRSNDLTGIPNGIDEGLWNPSTDGFLAANFDTDDMSGKPINKANLQRHFGLAVDPDTTLLGSISRLTYQKGIDVLLAAMDRMLTMPVQLVILGAGEPEYEEELRRWARLQNDRVGVHIGYDEGLAHVIEAGADIFLLPSRYEPCGLNQMYSMRYGTPPVARRTGGLVDTIVDATPSNVIADQATGFLFDSPNAEDLYGAVKRALALRGNVKAWQHIRRNGMVQDFSWSASADRYLALYGQLIAAPYVPPHWAGVSTS